MQLQPPTTKYAAAHRPPSELQSLECFLRAGLWADTLQPPTTSSYLSFKHYFGVAMERTGLSIGEIARQARCSVPSVRYYEQIGLLPSAMRRAGGHRIYESSDLRRLNFIRQCRTFGFSVTEIRELLAVSARGAPCAEAREIAAARLHAVRVKLLELQALEQSLAKFVRNCDARCEGNLVEDCTLFDDIAGKNGPACCG